jgi:soluble lytic murein transglycosylase
MAALAPRVGPMSDSTSALPAILARNDIALYTEIFDLQNDGQWDKADRLIAQLSDDSLMGHVLFQRYMHPTAYRSSYQELKNWLADYADHPGATRIYDLALKRKPSSVGYPRKPQAVEMPAMDAVVAFDEPQGGSETESPATESRKYAGKSSSQRAKIRTIQSQIRSLVQRGNVTVALKNLDTKANRALFDPVSFAESLGVIARGYFRYHEDKEAMAVAKMATKLAGDDAARAHWWGGLAAFRAKDWNTAAAHFAALSLSVEADDWLRAAGGFWASRAYLIGGEPQNVSAMLQRATEMPRTFYGLLATRALGQTPPLDFEMPVLSDTETEFLLEIPAARRAIALIETGQTNRADEELRRFVDELPPSFVGTLLALADRAGLADVAFRLGRDMERRQKVSLDGALYPVPGWEPEDGFGIDRALIFAIVRQESQFRSRAISSAGARGLMQLMPATAGYMAGDRFHGSSRAELFEPGLNLSLGQKYVHHVLNLAEIDGNLLYALAAYNAGPGNLQRWRAKIDYADDPLLFIESLPSRETRAYIEHVLSNFWIYRLRLKQNVDSLDMLIGGSWPIYVSQDQKGPPTGEPRTVRISAE